MKIVAVVPMKLNNERLPNKNTKSFTNGNPLCNYILETLLKIPLIDEIYVYCSNPDIKNFIPQGVKFLQRSASLDQGTIKMNEVLHSFAVDVSADLYVLTHATAPFLRADSIIEGLNAVLSNKYDSALSVKKIQSFLWKDGTTWNYDLTAIPRTQDIEPIYEETSGFYIYDHKTIVDRNRRIGDNPFLVEIGRIESTDIDELEDFEVADAIHLTQITQVMQSI